MSINPELLASSDYYVEALARKTGIVYPNKPIWNAGDPDYPDAPFDLTFSGGGGAYHYNASRLLAPATADVPVLAYDAEGNVLGLAGFGGIQNFFKNSEPVTSPPLDVETNVTFGANTFGIGLSGSIFFGDNSVNRIAADAPIDAGTYTMFAFVKKDGGGAFTFGDGATQIARFQTAAGAVATGYTYTEVKPDVYLVRGLIVTAVTTNAGIYKSVTRSVDAFEASGIMCVVGNWGFAPYVKTTGTAVTAPANIITGALPAEITGASAISGACVVNVPANIVGVSQFIFDLHDNTNDERIVLLKSTTNIYRLEIITGGAVQATIESITLPLNQDVAFSWSVTANSVKFFMNGVQQGVTDTSATFPTVTNIHLISSRLGLSQLNGYCQLTALKGAVADDATLIAWSTI